jgi:hypothetical protein
MKKAILILCVFSLFACQDDNALKMVEVDLLKYGVPITIQAPESAAITKPSGDSEVWIVDSASYFKIQVIKTPTLSGDVATAKAEELELAKSLGGFSKLIMEEKDGFIYEENYDTISYDFKHIVVSGNNKYVFQKLLIEIPTQEQVEMMYKAVKN